MIPSQLTNFLKFAIKNRFPILVKSKPGIGKSDIVQTTCDQTETDLIISHPVVSDPTDYKGLPFAGTDGQAHFLPFDDLARLINATKPTVFFLDDLGQAPASVQAACMQLILARRVNGHKVSDNVTFLAATNGKEHRAGVSGILEPVKSRFASIVELEVSVDDWVMWALNNNMPVELISFIRWKPEMIGEDFVPTKDITNSPSPRTIAKIGAMQNAGLPKDLEFEAFKGAAGEAFAVEYQAFLKMYRDLPNLDSIISNPMTAKLSSEPSVLFALAYGLGHRMNVTNMDAIIQYLERIEQQEIGVVVMKDAARRNEELIYQKAYIRFQARMGAVILS